MSLKPTPEVEVQFTFQYGGVIKGHPDSSRNLKCFSRNQTLNKNSSGNVPLSPLVLIASNQLAVDRSVVIGVCTNLLWKNPIYVVKRCFYWVLSPLVLCWYVLGSCLCILKELNPRR
jgi:hypothetical protein